MTEARCLKATVQESDNEEWLPICCRFSDGQKFVAVQVDAAYPELAFAIARFLTQEDYL
jgi:hypothetical protein